MVRGRDRFLGYRFIGGVCLCVGVSCSSFFGKRVIVLKEKSENYRFSLDFSFAGRSLREGGGVIYLEGKEGLRE